MKFLLLLLFVFVSFGLYAQAPNQFTFQAVVRNSNNQLLQNQAIGVRISILKGSSTGSVEYSENFTPNPSTNTNGLLTVQIGSGTVISGSFNNIDWSAGLYFIKIEMDPNGGSNFSIVSTQQLLSVPYALQANKSNNANFAMLSDSATNSKNASRALFAIKSASSDTTIGKIVPSQIKANGANNGQVLKWNGTEWAPQNDIGGGNGDNWGSQAVQTDATLTGNGVSGNAIKIAPQGATLGQVLKWNGSTWKPQDDNDLDNNNANELQQISLNGGRVSVNKNGGTIFLPDSSSSNELQTVSVSNDSIKLSGNASKTKIPFSNYAWGLKGNSGTNNANFIGTTDNQSVIFKVNNVISGKLDSFRYQTYLGYGAGANDTAKGTTFIGYKSGVNNKVFGTTAVGYAALFSNTTGSENTAIGVTALAFNTTGRTNIAMGYSALYKNISGNFNIALGGYALNDNITGNNNVAIGFNALTKHKKFDHNIAIGINALSSDTSGIGNVSLGSEALKSSTDGAYNIAIGFQSMANVKKSTTQLAIGYQALMNNTTGAQNTAVGYRTLISNTTGKENVAIGSAALLNSTAGNYNVAIGSASMSAQTNVGSDNVAIGASALKSNTTGFDNTVIGSEAMLENKTGDNNSAFGRNSLRSNRISSKNTAMGSASLQNHLTGEGNTAFGFTALINDTSGIGNTSIGASSLYSNSKGSYNTALGYNTLNNASTANYNVALGNQSLYGITTGERNVAIGNSAGMGNLTGSNNVFIGDQAGFSETGSNKLYISNNSTSSPLIYGDFNTKKLTINDSLQTKFFRLPTGSINGYFLKTDAKGNASWTNPTSSFWTLSGNPGTSEATNFIGTPDNIALIFRMKNIRSGKLDSVTQHTFWGFAAGKSATGIANTLIGYRAGNNISTGVSNTILGDSAGLALTTGSRNTRIGAATTNGSEANWTNTGMFGYAALNPGGNNVYRIGNSSVTGIGGQVGWTTVSDKRIKQNVQHNIPGLDFILKLTPVSYTYNLAIQHKIMNPNSETTSWDGKTEIEKMRFSGFLAQDVDSIANSIGYEFSGVEKPKSENGLYGIRYAEFVVPIIKAIQEQQSIIANQQKEIDYLKSLIKK